MPSLAEGAGVDNEVLEAFLASVCERADDEGVNLLTTASQELFERRVPMVEWPFELEGLLLVPTCLALGPHWVLMVADSVETLSSTNYQVPTQVPTTSAGVCV
jgi:hypothetical protein